MTEEPVRRAAPGKEQPRCHCHNEPMDWRGRSRPNGWSCAVARRARQNATRAERYHANWEAENYARYRRRLRERMAYKRARIEELLASLTVKSQDVV